jgi:methylmalonyl-CoA/ethylmalonyl-CoA epimerase
VVRRIHHVGIVVKRLADAYHFYRDTLGLPLIKEAEIADQGVRAALLAAGDSEIELLEPTSRGNGIDRFLTKRGEGLHHVCFDVPEVAVVLRDLAARQVPLLDAAPRRGLAGEIAFLHPKACAGVLVELATPDVPEREPSGVPLRLKRLVIGGHEPKETAEVFQSLFGLAEIAMNGGRRTMLAVGRGALLVVPADEVGGTEGMVALSLVADDFAGLTAAFDRAKVRFIRGTGEVTVEPVSSYGVHLHISRYE